MIRLRKALAVAATGTLAVSTGLGAMTLAAPAAGALTGQGENIIERPAGTLTADALPTVQINKGVVWDQQIVGDTVYVGGEFAHARPYGAAVDTQLMPRQNLMAYNITTGEATSWAPNANGTVLATALSPDKTRLYVGGAFTTIDGRTHNRVAAFDTATGALVDSFAPDVNGNVSAIVATNDTVYIGGFFTSADGQSRTRLAAYTRDGALTGWKPTADSYVRGMAFSNDGSRLVIGGSFSYVNGAYQPGTASLDPTTGSTQTWNTSRYITNRGDNAGIYSLRNNGNGIVITGWSYSGLGRFEGVASLDDTTGNIQWMADCHGDSYDTATLGGIVYAASHHHNCENVGVMPTQMPENYQRLDGWTDKATSTVQTNKETGYANFAGQAAPSAVSWHPKLDAGSYTGQYQSAWSLATDGRYLVVGGEFPTVNNVAQNGLTRFAVDSIAPKKMGPRFSVPAKAGVSGKNVRFSWQANSDWDGVGLKYDVYRIIEGGSKELVGSLQQDASYWNRPWLSMTDTKAKPNTTYQYFARATDADGNTKDSAWISVTTGEGVGTSAYSDTVTLDQPKHFWRMNEASGTTVKDEVGSLPLTLRSGATLGATGADGGLLGTALSTNGTTTGYGATSTAESTTDDTTVEAWVKTTSTRGGKIVGHGTTTGTSSMYTDRNLYMTNSGKVAWGVYDGWSNQAIISPSAINDGQWHHVAGTLGADGSKLYVDGQLVGSDASMDYAPTRKGYWHVGCDSTALWPSAPSSRCLSGTIDEVAVYDHVLNATAIAGHVKAAAPDKAPVAKFTATCDETGLCTFDASGSSDPDGQVVDCTWDFGDGATATGQKVQHTFKTGGNHDVRLTVTDDGGADNSTTQSVAVELPNQAPVAGFKATCTGTDCVLDGGASTDADGTIATWAWDFGDGTTGSGKETSHSFPKAGTYTVSLTVTDDKGATNTTTRQVVVFAAGDSSKVVAQDGFNQVRTNWGTAEVGGQYSYGSQSSFSTSGTAGVITATKGVTARATLGTVQATDSSTTVDLSLDQLTTGGGLYTRVEARTSGSNGYWAYARWNSNGTITLTLARQVAGAQTDLKSVTLPGTYAAGDTYRIRFDVTGTGTTTLAATMWKVGDAQPDAPQVTTTDTTAALQTAGAPAISTYLSGVATAPVKVSVDNLLVTASK